ncbi:MAG: LacI family transcriptional regulator [Muribaculaceae bacterium]|nr:LacI family transcriptional regulator [Muribaculaceae bacterium]
MKHVTIKDIASRLGLSVSTVSRALADDRNIRLETKRLITTTAEAMGYRRNHTAALLRSGKTGTIGMIVNEMLTPFASKVYEGIQHEMSQAGYRIQIANSHDDPELELKHLRMMNHARVDGLIVSPCIGTKNISEFKEYNASGHPIVFFSRYIDSIDASKVVTNDYDKAFYLTQHLIHCGRKRIVHINWADGPTNFDNIKRGFLDCLRKFSISPDPQMMLSLEKAAFPGQEAVRMILERELEFDAVFACTDIIAIDVMNELRYAGYRIPEDVAIAGFYGTQLSKLVYPALTTAEPPHHEIGRKAAQLLLEKLSNPEKENETIMLDSRLCLRESSMISN